LEDEKAPTHLAAIVCDHSSVITLKLPALITRVVLVTLGLDWLQSVTLGCVLLVE
jgi:hypothetical protein